MSDNLVVEKHNILSQYLPIDTSVQTSMLTNVAYSYSSQSGPLYDGRVTSSILTEAQPWLKTPTVPGPH